MTFPIKSTYDNFGGELQDRSPAKNFHIFGATDLPAEDFNQCRASLAGATQTGCQAYIKYDFINGTLVEYEAAWDKIKTPTPFIGEADVGMCYVELPPFYYDLRGKKHTMNVNFLHTNTDVAQSNAAIYSTSGQQIAPNYLYFFIFLDGQFTEDFQYVDLFFF